MKAITAKQAKEIDRVAREKFGIPTLVLMENAGRAVAEHAIGMCKKHRPKVAIFCGKGNNGGDGFVAARHLLIKASKVSVYLIGSRREVRGEAKTNLDIFLKMGQKVLRPSKKLPSEVAKFDIVIDAIFGVGLKGKIKGPAARIIDIINNTARKILAVDIPSGLDATTGEASGACIKANETVTFVAPKKGFFKKDGPALSGKIKTVDIGFVRKKS